ncbi:hypothetical protein PV328_004242 [Microctonus aethiopoides]|uniref:Uncharacterized protein n=1 Tax=Microctonus aethiopoides TaxID=144406 RepID=A0AA39KLG8_9HYME|nr:hypothetical protein PV328_004242 [Microctonus aethiopoides]
MYSSIDCLRDNTVDASSSFEDRRKKADIKYAAFIVEKNIPFRLAADILKFFQKTGQDFEFELPANHKCLNEINLGSDCEEYLNQLIINGNESIVTVVRQKCLAFYIIAAKEICKRLPINDPFLSKLKVFMPDSERIFSYLPDSKTKKRNKLSAVSVNATCVLKSAMKMRNETALHMVIDENHLSRMTSDILYTVEPIHEKFTSLLHRMIIN